MSALTRIEAFTSAPFRSPGTGCLEAGFGAFADESAFELCEGSEEVEDEPPAARISVDGLLQAPEAYAAGAEVLGPGDEVLERTAEAVEAPDDQGVSGPKVGERLRKVRSLGGAARGVFEDPVATGFGERIAFEVEGLVVGGDAGVADQHRFVSRNSSWDRSTLP